MTVVAKGAHIDVVCRTDLFAGSKETSESQVQGLPRLPQPLLALSETAGLKPQPTYLIWLELNRAKPLRKMMRPTTAAGTSM